MSGVQPCRWCGDPIVIRTVRGGRNWPFDNELRPPEQVGELARYVPVNAGGRVVLVPAVEMSSARLAPVRWYVTRHVCAPWLAAHHRDGTHVDDLGAAIAKVLGLDLAEAS